MQRLLVLRHGTTEEWRPGLLDADRSLTEAGHEQASAAGSWLRAQGWLPERVVASPARRTRQTAVETCRAAGIADGALTFDPRIYDARVETLEEIVSERNHAETLLLVGHQPGLGGLVVTLTQQVEPVRMPPGALAVLRTPRHRGEPWTLETLWLPEMQAQLEN